MSNTVEEIPEWIVKYDKANHQSSAGKAIRYLMERLKVVSTPQVVSEEDIERMAKAFLKKLDEESGTMWTEDDEEIVKAFVEFHKSLLNKQNDEPSKGDTDFEPVASHSCTDGNSIEQARPKIVCYCGSLRKAKEAFMKAEYQSLVKGEIAMLPCCMFVDIEREYGLTSEYKQKADEQHKRKIDIADEVFILNVGGYIGESTKSEIEYAISIGKPVVYLEAKGSPLEPSGELKPIQGFKFLDLNNLTNIAQL